MRQMALFSKSLNVKMRICEIFIGLQHLFSTGFLILRLSKSLWAAYRGNFKAKWTL